MLMTTKNDANSLQTLKDGTLGSSTVESSVHIVDLAKAGCAAVTPQKPWRSEGEAEAALQALQK